MSETAEDKEGFNNVKQFQTMWKARKKFALADYTKLLEKFVQNPSVGKAKNILHNDFAAVAATVTDEGLNGAAVLLRDTLIGFLNDGNAEDFGDWFKVVRRARKGKVVHPLVSGVLAALDLPKEGQEQAHSGNPTHILLARLLMGHPKPVLNNALAEVGAADALKIEAPTHQRLAC